MIKKADLDFSKDFEFGLASAPGHAEDLLDDIWKRFADEGKVTAYSVPRADERLRFWSEPEVELDWAEKTGITVYRLGFDWGRIMPAKNQFDETVLKHYQKLIVEIKKRKMKVMLTLMHHSVPIWFQEQGGWLRDDAIEDFVCFSKKLIDTFHDEVVYWITFNEPNIFVVLAYSAGIWPPAEKRSMLSLFSLGPFKGVAIQALDRIVKAHSEVYRWAHLKYPEIEIGFAHHLSFHTGKTFLNRIRAYFSGKLMNWYVADQVEKETDFFGFNYYGAEWIKGSQVDIDPDEEYSEAGRAVYPLGLYKILKTIQSRYLKNSNKPIYITENGIADASDFIRPAYLIEHLAVIDQARQEGVPVKMYIHWTLSDNIEWADGYGPKFGLLEVRRDEDLKRVPRDSFYLFQKTVKTKRVLIEDREKAWNHLRANVGKNRPFCRANDGVLALDPPILRPVSSKDWRMK